MYTQEQITQALNIIRNTCEEYECEKCPFRIIEGGCYITTLAPESWAINFPQEWTAFIQ